MKLLTCVLILIVIIILYKLYDFNNEKSNKILINLNGELVEIDDTRYKRMNSNHLSESSEDRIVNNLLEEVNMNITKLIDYLDKKYANTTNINIIDGISKLKSNYKYENLIEHIPKWYSNETSYTVNKGEILALCLRHKDIPKRFHDINVIMFVTVHELAHIFSVSVGHNDEFWTNFKFLLNESIDVGIYNFDDYNKHNKHYCGMEINYTPLTDFSLPNLI